MSSSLCAVAIGAGPPSNVSAGGNVSVGTGGAFTVSLQSTAGLSSWRLRATSKDIRSWDGVTLAYQQGAAALAPVVLSAPTIPGRIVFSSEADDGRGGVQGISFNVLVGIDLSQSTEVTGVLPTADQAAQTVTTLQSRPVSSAAPNADQRLGWDGAAWSPRQLFGNRTRIAAGATTTLNQASMQTVQLDSTAAACTVILPLAPVDRDVVVILYLGATVSQTPPVIDPNASSGNSITDFSNAGAFTSSPISPSVPGAALWYEYDATNTRWVQVV
jgi:hypothetical protein